MTTGRIKQKTGNLFFKFSKDIFARPFEGLSLRLSLSLETFTLYLNELEAK